MTDRIDASTVVEVVTEFTSDDACEDLLTKGLRGRDQRCTIGIPFRGDLITSRF